MFSFVEDAQTFAVLLLLVIVVVINWKLSVSCFHDMKVSIACSGLGCEAVHKGLRG